MWEWDFFSLSVVTHHDNEVWFSLERKRLLERDYCKTEKIDSTYNHLNSNSIGSKRSKKKSELHCPILQIYTLY